VLEIVQGEYSVLLKAFQHYFDCGPDRLNEEFTKERNEFEIQFVNMNCQIQNNRSDIHQLKEKINEDFLEIQVESLKCRNSMKNWKKPWK
jgi:hypothetical protein